MKNKQNVRPQTLAIVIVISLAILALLHNAFLNIRKLYGEHLYNSASELREHFLQSTVKNLMEDITTERDVRKNEFEDQVESCIDYVHRLAREAKDAPELEVKKYFDGRPDSINWTYMAYDVNTNDVLVDSAGLLGDVWSGEESELDNSFVSSDRFTIGNTRIIYGITKLTLDSIVKNSISKKVMYNDFEGNTRMWINEIRNYNGGKNYAVTVVNPEERSSAGRLISADVKDAEGKEYLKDELEALQNDGEVCYRYHIKNKDGSISTMLVYSMLYSDYDWIVSMGSDMGDVREYVVNSKAPVEKYLLKFELSLAVMFIVLIAFMVIMTLRTDREFTFQITNMLKNQVERDALTKATSRQYGEEKLRQFFDAYKKGKPSPAIMLLDVDYFKEINDTYGHDVGDVVLKRIVTSLYHTFRKSDYLIRWGGDEFVGVYLGLDEDGVQMVADKVMDAVHEVTVITDDGTVIRLTASVGIGHFEPMDTEYMDGIKRADNMLYDSKAGGRNQYHIAARGTAIDMNKKSDSLSRTRKEEKDG